MNQIVSCPLCDAELKALAKDVFKCSGCGEIYETWELLDYLRAVTETEMADKSNA